MKRNTSFTHHFRNGVSILFGILLLSVSLSSCLDETWVEPSGSEQGIKMYIRIPAPTIGQTRAGETQNDDYVDPSSVYVFVLSGIKDEANNHVLEVVNAVASTEGLFYAKLTPSEKARHVYIVANATDIIKDTDTEGKNVIHPGMTLGQLKLQLKKSVGTTGDVISGSINPQPMFGTFELSQSGITPETTIGTADAPVLLVRTTSKITVTNNTTNGNFQLLGANLVNAPKLGYIVSGQPDTGDRYPTGAGGDIKKMISTPSASNEKETVLYCFESTKKAKVGTSTYVIIEAKYLSNTYYYRLNLNNNELDYPLLRNNHYMVDIKKVNKEGYKTVGEAMENPAANIDYVVNVIDETGRNMVSNGEYYLAVSQTEYYYFTEEGEEFGKQTVATVTHNAPTTVSGTYKVGAAPEAGFPPSEGGVQSFPLAITMNPNTTEETITLKLGDLERVIKVYHKKLKKSDAFHFGAFLKDFAVKGGYIAGKVDKEYESWIRLTNIEHNSDEDDQHSSIEQPDGKFFVRVKANLGSDKSPLSRTGQLDLFREDSEGNARVVFKQNMFDIYTAIVDQAKIAPYTYVGTFHRRNETGERLIRIHADNIKGSGNSFHWKAFIIAGDFIRLSKEKSDDTGIHFNEPYGKGDNPVWNTTGLVEKNGQLKDPKTELEVEGPISFRVGLTSKLASQSSKPRYGLIAVVANWDSEKPITRYIYVRQGEEADYLMRKEDEMVGISHATGRRELADRYSPYNLTDPNGTKFLTQPHLGDPTGFVEFPSQAGYLYESMYVGKDVVGRDTYKKGRGWLADGEPNSDYKSSPWANWAKEYENCPDGYHRPRGHSSSTHVNTGDILVRESPIRQSLWLYPQSGMLSETQNFIIGYIADGYYDRREMQGPIAFEKNIPSQPTYVGNGATLAYIGALAFNPYNSASLFIPFSGYRSGGGHNHRGMNSYIWTSDMKTATTCWTAAFGLLIEPKEPGEDSTGNEKELFRADNYPGSSNQAFAVRCVKE